MATLIYLWYHAVDPLNWNYDRVVVCMLAALEGSQYLRILVHLVTRR